MKSNVPKKLEIRKKYVVIDGEQKNLEQIITLYKPIDNIYTTAQYQYQKENLKLLLENLIQLCKNKELTQVEDLSEVEQLNCTTANNDFLRDINSIKKLLDLIIISEKLDLIIISEKLDTKIHTVTYSTYKELLELPELPEKVDISKDLIEI